MRRLLLSSARCMAPDDGGAGGAPAPETAAPESPAEFLSGVSETAAAQPDLTPPTEPEGEPEPTPKPDKVERRIANLTRKMADEARAREAAERRADAAEALLKAGKPDAEPAPSRTSGAPTDIEARAAQIVEEREFNRRLSEIDATGKKEIGADQWEQAKATLTGLGATGNQAFLQALAEAENPAKLFAHFADDTDALMDILGKGAAAIGAKIGRLDAQMSKPVTRPLSGAPKPAPKVTGSATPPAPDPYNYPKDMSMKAWGEMMADHLPAHLGGKKKRA